MWVKVVDLKETLYTDQTGNFPYLPSKGDRYVMVAYHSDSDYMFMEAMKNRSNLHMIQIYQKIMDRTKGAGLSVKGHILDNESSKEYMWTIKKNEPTYELRSIEGTQWSKQFKLQKTIS